jgi:flagella basal body P-ring formation protein FlgA
MNWPNNGNGGRPLSRKKTVRLLVALTILAWATQTLLSQWGLGAQAQEPDLATPPPTTAPAAAEEKFVPGTARFAAGATIEIRAEATVVGEEIRLRQIARWAEGDQRVLAPVGDLVLARIGQGTPFRSISLDEIKQTLRDAGVNIAALNFVGASSCTVNRSDVHYDERIALQQWIEAKQTTGPAPATSPAESAVQTIADAMPASAPAVVEADRSARTLRDLLVEDLANRLALAPDSLQVDFKTQDQRLLNLAEPLFTFEIEPMRGRSLGEVAWLVLFVAGEDVQKATISATARAWQEQLVLTKPLAFKQVITADDVVERRTLVDRIAADEPLLQADEVIGQQASRELKPGTVLTARMVDAVQLVKAGQFVTVTLTQGTVNIKTVAKALEGGTYGQTIRVKNEATKDVFQVILTGPQTATMNLSSPPPAAQDRETGKLASSGQE